MSLQDVITRIRTAKKMKTDRVSSESGLKEFTGNERRLWIYLYRVKKTATEDIITYISRKPGYEDSKIIVKEMVAPLT